MFTKNTVGQVIENIGETAPEVDPAELVPLAELASEGFGPWDSPYTKAHVTSSRRSRANSTARSHTTTSAGVA